MERVDEEYWILVMGMTGSGKSTFINLLAEEEDRVRVGHSLNSTTVDVQDHVCHLPDGRIVRLLDTPGFDDTHRSDTEVLQTVANALNELYESGRRVDGVIYMHPIIDPRMSGAALKSLGIFRRICGESYFPHIALVSTMWESLKGTEARVAAEARLTDLIEKPEFWADLVGRGSVAFQHDGSANSAMNIVKNLLKRSQQASLQLQLEMRQGKTLAKTEAGSFVEGEVLKMRESYEKEVERLRAEFLQVKVEGDVREEESVLEQTEAVQAKISSLKHDVASLHVDARDLEDLKGSQRRRRPFTARDWEKAWSDDEQSKIAKELQELRDQKNHLERDIYGLKQEAALLERNKHPEQEREVRRMRLVSRHGQPYLERRRPSPNEVQLSARHPRDEKRVKEVTRNAERDHPTSVHGILRRCTSPTSPPASPPTSPHHSRVADGDFAEWRAPPRLGPLRRVQTVPSNSTFERR